MTLWRLSDSKLLAQRSLQRRANAVVFSGDGEVLIADKSGDVFKFGLKDENEKHQFGELVLGHLSMLLDVAVSPCKKYVSTLFSLSILIYDYRMTDHNHLYLQDHYFSCSKDNFAQY